MMSCLLSRHMHMHLHIQCTCTVHILNANEKGKIKTEKAKRVSVVRDLKFLKSDQDIM